jgi:carbonic anhydrase
MNCVPKIPINITVNNYKGDCNNCTFEYNYHDSACAAENKGDHIKLSYDIIPKPPVKFNNTSLDVEKVLIYSPSLHLYDGQKQSGEIMIIHKGYKHELTVSIPIKIDDSSNSLLDNIAVECGKTIIDEDSTAVLNIMNYNLSKFIDKSPYIYYNAGVSSECNTKSHVIVFGNSNSYITITNNNMNIIRALITYKDVFTSDSPYYKNTQGPISLSGNEKYIRCYSSNEIPSNLPPKEEIQEQNETKENFENFTNTNDIINDYGIHVNTIVITSLALFTGYIYLRNVITKN